MDFEETVIGRMGRVCSIIIAAAVRALPKREIVVLPSSEVWPFAQSSGAGAPPEDTASLPTAARETATSPPNLEPI